MPQRTTRAATSGVRLMRELPHRRREAQLASRALDRILNVSPSTARAVAIRGALREANGGENPPLCAQYVYLLLTALPQDVARYPRSAEFRRAAAAYTAREALPFVGTRRDLAEGLAWLRTRGLLASWVVAGGRGDGHADAR